MTKIQEKLFALQDEKYRDFQGALIPGKSNSTMIGVRTPLLRSLAKELYPLDETASFMESLPHEYFDENQLHAFLIENERDFDTCLALTERFLPYVDNWATCDQLSPKTFRKNLPELEKKAVEWCASEKPFTVRFGIKMLMSHFLDDGRFDEKYLKIVTSVRSEHYYVKMMIAWYVATALAKQWDAALVVLKNHELDPWVHQKAIQKAVESRRISAEQKDLLRSL